LRENKIENVQRFLLLTHVFFPSLTSSSVSFSFYSRTYQAIQIRKTN